MKRSISVTNFNTNSQSSQTKVLRFNNNKENVSPHNNNNQCNQPFPDFDDYTEQLYHSASFAIGKKQNENNIENDITKTINIRNLIPDDITIPGPSNKPSTCNTYNNMDVMNERTQSHHGNASLVEVTQIVENEHHIMNSIFSDYLLPKSNDNSFTICSMFQNSIAHIQKTKQFTFKEIINQRKCHALAIDTRTLYSFPLILDLDHIKCNKQHTCTMTFDTIKYFANDIYKKVCEILRIKKINMCVEYRMCGLHIYFDCNVSVIMYEYIICELTEAFRDEHNYLFDKPTSLPLPNSCKVINKPYVYLPLLENGEKENVIFNLNADFYDFVLYLAPELLNSSYRLISKVQTITNNFDKRWDELEYKSEILQSSMHVKFIPKQHIISRLLVGNKNIITEEYTLFNNYISTLRNTAIKDVTFDWTICDTNELDPAIENCMILLANKIATIAYGQNNITNLNTIEYVSKTWSEFNNTEERDNFYNSNLAISNFKYIYKAMCGPSETCGYAFYIFVAIFKYLEDQLKISNEKICKNIEILLESCSSDSTVCNDMIKYNFRKIREAPFCIKECATCFQYVEVFKIIAARESFAIEYNFNLHETIVAAIQAQIYPETTLDEMEQKFNTIILPYILPSIKSSDNEYYVFNTHVWEHKVITDPKKILNMFQKFETILKINKTITRKNISDTLQNYFQQMKQIPVTFGLYKIFINTSYGVFNTVTGLYMTPLPILYFLQAQCKRFCTLPMNDIEFTIQNNIDLIHAYKTTARVCEIWRLDQGKIRYLITIIPGLLSLDNSSTLNQTTREKILNNLSQVYKNLCTEDNIEFLCKHFKKVVEFYHFNFITISIFMKILDYLMLNNVEVTDSTIFSAIKTMNLDTLTRNALNEFEPSFDIDYTKSGTQYINDILNKCGIEEISYMTYYKFIYAYSWLLLYKFDMIQGTKIDVTDPELYINTFKEISQDKKSLSNLQTNNIITLHNLIDSTTISDNHIASINKHEEDKVYDKSFLIGTEKYDVDHFSSESHINSVRGLFIAFREMYNYHEPGLPEELVGSITNLLYTFKFNNEIIFEYLSLLGLMFQPKHNQKKFLVHKGIKNAGKSFLANMLKEINGISSFTMNTCLKDNKNDANPKMIRISSNYLICINEFDSFENSLLKCLTGEDSSDHRTLHNATYTKLQTVGFIFGSANEVPIVLTDNTMDKSTDKKTNVKHNADHAISGRITIFNFNCQYVEFDVAKIPNPLLLMVNNQAIIPKRFTAIKTAIGFSNIMYINFIQNLNKNGDIVPIIKNKESVDLYNEFMLKNNELYVILKRLNIIFDHNYYISQLEIKNMLKEFIDEESSDTAKNNCRFFKLWELFTKEFKHLENTINNQSIYIGLGKCTDMPFNIDVVLDESKSITQNDLRLYLRDYTGSVFDKELLLSIFTTKYRHKIVNNVYRGIGFRN